MRASLALVVLILVPCTAGARMAAPESAASPCTLTVFEDESYQGCEEARRQYEANEFLGTEFETGKRLSVVAEHAISLMRAWRSKNLDLIFSRAIRGKGSRSVGMEVDFEGTPPRAYLMRETTRLELQRHFAETASIESMAVEVLADSAGTSSGEITTRFWIARTLGDCVHLGMKVVDRFDYRESWYPKQGFLLGFEETGVREWSGAEAPAGALTFPHRFARRASAPR